MVVRFEGREERTVSEEMLDFLFEQKRANGQELYIGFLLDSPYLPRIHHPINVSS